jgi:hypothetical protein
VCWIALDSMRAWQRPRAAAWLCTEGNEAVEAGGAGAHGSAFCRASRYRKEATMPANACGRGEAAVARAIRSAAEQQTFQRPRSGAMYCAHY